jgi:hypothetical protein
MQALEEREGRTTRLSKKYWSVGENKAVLEQRSACRIRERGTRRRQPRMHAG